MPRPLYPWEETRYPLFRRLVGPHELLEVEEKLPPRFNPHTIQPVSSGYIDYTIMAPICIYTAYRGRDVTNIYNIYI